MSRLIRPENSVRILLYTGLCGAALIVGYGALKFAATRPAPAAPMVEQPPPVPLQHAVIAKTLIHRGAVIKAGDLDFLPIDGALPSTVQVSNEGVVGKVAIADIAESQFVLASQISADLGQAGLAMLVPAGFRAIAFRTTDEIAVGNFIRPGDRVDLQLILPDGVLPGGAAQRPGGSGSEAHTLLQDVQILAVGDLLTAAEDIHPDPAAAHRIELPKGVIMALTPQQVSQFVLARSIGTIFLALRNPTDPQSTVPDTATLTAIRGQTPREPVQVAQVRRPIELVTGSQTRTIYSVSSVGK